jgi:hypothetical protein
MPGLGRRPPARRRAGGGSRHGDAQPSRFAQRSRKIALEGADLALRVGESLLPAFQSPSRLPDLLIELGDQLPHDLRPLRRGHLLDRRGSIDISPDGGPCRRPRRGRVRLASLRALPAHRSPPSEPPSVRSVASPGVERRSSTSRRRFRRPFTVR